MNRRGAAWLVAQRARVGGTMPAGLTMLMLALAFAFFTMAAFGVASRVNLLAAGLAFWVLVQLLALMLKA